MIVAKKITIKGIVQGVGFRSFAHYYALKYNISGYAKNHSNGNVEIICKGEETCFDKFLEHIKLGPSGAKITEIDIQELSKDSINIKGFKITR